LAVFTSFLEASTEFFEVFTCFGGDIIKKLYNNSRRLSRSSNIHKNVASAWSIIDGTSMSISCQLFIDKNASLISVSEFLKSPLQERFLASNVNGIVDENDRATLMLIEMSLQIVLELLEIHVPLGWEKLVNTCMNV